MEHKKSGYQNQGADRRLPALGLAVLLGAAAGSLLCARWEWLQTLFTREGQAVGTFWQSLFPELALLVAMLLSGFVRSGCLTALVIAAGKGFLLSASSTCLVLEAGRGGYIQALCGALVPDFFALAALLLLGRQAMGLALARLRLPPGKGRRVQPDSAYFLTFLICLGLLLLSAGLRLWLSPKLWAAAQTFFPNT